MKEAVKTIDAWIAENRSTKVNEATVPDWKPAMAIPAGMSLPALISKLQELSDSGVKVVKFREEPSGAMQVWSQHGSDIEDKDMDQLPFQHGETEVNTTEDPDSLIDPGSEDKGLEDTDPEFKQPGDEYEDENPADRHLNDEEDPDKVLEGNRVLTFDQFKG